MGVVSCEAGEAAEEEGEGEGEGEEAEGGGDDGREVRQVKEALKETRKYVS